MIKLWRGDIYVFLVSVGQRWIKIIKTRALKYNDAISGFPVSLATVRKVSVGLESLLPYGSQTIMVYPPTGDEHPTYTPQTGAAHYLLNLVNVLSDW